jgi:WD40 repeat protein
LQDLLDSFRAIDWNHDGSLLAISERSNYICIYESSGKLLSRFKGDEKGVVDLAWHPFEDKLVAVGSQIGIYNLEGDTLNAFLPAKQEFFLLCVEWHPSGEFFAVGDYGALETAENKSLTFWKEDGTKLVQKIGSKGEYRNIRWNPDGSKIATATDKLLIYDQEGIILNKSKPSEDYLWGIDWNPGGSIIVTSSSNGVLTLWNNQAELIKEVQL